MSKKEDSFGINITAYCREHERYVEAQLAAGADRRELLAWHEQKIAWLQHERLIHLLVTMLATAVFFFAFSFAYKNPVPLPLAFLAVTGCLDAAYLMHYFRLENTVQHWYKIADRLRGPAK